MVLYLNMQLKLNFEEKQIKKLLLLNVLHCISYVSRKVIYYVDFILTVLLQSDHSI